MRMLRKNQIKMYYATLNKSEAQYETDDNGETIYVEVDGDMVPVIKEEADSGTKTEYSKPVEFFGNFAMSGGDSDTQEFGISVSDYNATIILPKTAVEIAEGSLIWVKSEIDYLDSDKSVVDPTSADYTCIKVSESLNLVKYVLKAMTK